MGKRILVVDDDADILEMLTILLTDSGYEIETRSVGDRVFEAINDFHPDLVLMDVMLATMDGRVICRQLKSNSDTQNIPVILISGTHDLALSINQPGTPDDFVAKPFDIDHLLGKIKLQLTA